MERSAKAEVWARAGFLWVTALILLQLYKSVTIFKQRAVFLHMTFAKVCDFLPTLANTPTDLFYNSSKMYYI